MAEISSEPRSGTEGDMKILFLITVRGHGRGGHFHSLNHISEEMGNSTNVGICSYGGGKSEVIENNPYFLKHIRFTGGEIISLKKEWSKLLKEFAPDLIHCFDADSYNMFTLLFDQNRYTIALNKCGGPNPKKFPLSQNLILFSEENKEWFRNNSKFEKTNIEVIPNRVNPRILEFSSEKPILKENSFCFVRIARIGKSYIRSIRASIQLIKLLVEKGVKVHLYIIGAIQDVNIAEELNNEIIGLPITLITEDKYTAKASDMLYLADVVIATGRGIMEGTYLGKPILTPSKNSEIPILVDESNFDAFFRTNFSERNRAPEKSIELNTQKILGLIEDHKFYDEMSGFSKSCFQNYFSTELGVSKYVGFYEKYLGSKSIKFNRLSDLMLKLKTWGLFFYK